MRSVSGALAKNARRKKKKKIKRKKEKRKLKERKHIYTYKYLVFGNKRNGYDSPTSHSLNLSQHTS
jgi:hypothetical protein